MARKVFVLGTAFSGSTMLSMLLSQVPGVSSPGEIHWLLDDPRLECSVHRGSCSLVYGLDRVGLSQHNLYNRVADFLRGDVLVSTDKWCGHAQRFLLPGEADAIILFKRPEAAVFSFLRHGSMATAAVALGTYCDWYEKDIAFGHGPFFRRCCVVSYDRLARRPREIVSEICPRLDLGDPSFSPDLRPEDWHNIGGNPPTHRDSRYAGQAVLLDERWKQQLDPQALTLCQSSSRARTVHDRLDALSIGGQP